MLSQSDLCLMHEYDTSWMLVTLIRHSVWFQDDRTPLHLAASFGQLDVVKYLIAEVRVDAGVRNKVSHPADG